MNLIVWNELHSVLCVNVLKIVNWQFRMKIRILSRHDFSLSRQRSFLHNGVKINMLRHSG